jgi:alkylated DNA repair dioxygenase AlkB
MKPDLLFKKIDIDGSSFIRTIRKECLFEHHDPNRREILFNRSGKDYLFNKSRGVRPHTPQPEPAELTRLWGIVDDVMGHRFEVCFINDYYRNGAHIGWHQDNSPSIDWDRPVAVLSVGETAVVRFRRIDNPEMVFSFECESGTICSMGSGVNDTYQHQVPGVAVKGHGRMSLVFRGVK